MTFDEKLYECVFLLSKIKGIVDEQENNDFPDPGNLSFTKKEKEKKLDIIIAKLKQANFKATTAGVLWHTMQIIQEEIKSKRLDRAQNAYNELREEAKTELLKFLAIDEVLVDSAYFMKVMQKSIVREFSDAQIAYILKLYNDFGSSEGTGLYAISKPDGSISYELINGGVNGSLKGVLCTISPNDRDSRAKATDVLIQRFMLEVYDKLTTCEKDTINAWLRIDMETGRLIQPVETNESTIEQLIGDVATRFKEVQEVYSEKKQSLEQALPQVDACLDKLDSGVNKLFSVMPTTIDQEPHHMDVTSTMYITDELSDNTHNLIDESHASKNSSASDKSNKSRVDKIIDFFIEKLHQFLDAVNRLGEYLKSLVPEVKTTSRKMRF